MTKKRLWIISELFYPEQSSTSYILGEIAKKLELKYDVRIIAGPKIYDKNNIVSNSIDSKLEDLKIYRVWAPKLNKNKLVQRAFRLIWISFGLFIKSGFKVKSGDRLLFVTNPNLLIILLAWLKKVKKISVVLLVHDVFPENTIPTHFISSSHNLKYKLFKKIFDHAYSAFEEFIVLGRDMKSILENKTGNSGSKKIYVIENWGDTIRIQPKSRIQACLPVDKIVLNYAGNIGRCQGLMEFVNIISKVKNKNILLNIYGSGAIEDQIRQFIVKNKLEKRIKLLGSYKREDQNDVLNDCDLAIVSLEKGMYGLGVPSKTYNILAAGKPILYFGDPNSEIDLLVRNENIGFSFSLDQEQYIIDFLEKLSLDDFDDFDDFLLMGKRARNLVENKYSKKEILNRFYDII